MAVTAEWPASIAGQSTKVIETSIFMGRKQRVLVTYLHFTNPEANAMLYASGLDRPEFEALLSGGQDRGHSVGRTPDNAVGLLPASTDNPLYF
jgi:hypothetical protein